jgi:hypothetical protein
MHYCKDAHSNIISTRVFCLVLELTNSIHLSSGDHILYHIPDTKLYMYINAIFSPVQLES